MASRTPGPRTGTPLMVGGLSSLGPPSVGPQGDIGPETFGLGSRPRARPWSGTRWKGLRDLRRPRRLRPSGHEHRRNPMKLRRGGHVTMAGAVLGTLMLVTGPAGLAGGATGSR